MYDPDSIESFERVLLWRRIGILAKKISPVIALLPIAAGILFAVQAGAPMTSQAPLGREVAGIEYKQLAAWNRHDLPGYLSFYWNSPELISSSNGDELVGYSALASQFLGAFSKDPSSMGNARVNRLRVKPLGPDTAVVSASYVVTTSKHVYSCEETSLVRRFSEGWRIVFESTNIHSQ